MFTNDWIMRQIELMAQGLGELLHVQKESDDISIEEVVDDNISRTIKKNLSDQLDEFLENNDFCQAEDLLFACVESFPRVNFLSVGLDFYAKLQEKSDEVLLKSNFSREEISKGIIDLKKECANDPNDFVETLGDVMELNQDIDPQMFFDALSHRKSPR